MLVSDNVIKRWHCEEKVIMGRNQTLDLWDNSILHMQIY